MKIKLIAFLSLILICILVFFFKNNSPQAENPPPENIAVSSDNSTTNVASPQDEPVALAQNELSQVATVSETSKDPDAFLKAKGFVEDPNNPDQLMKKTQDANGKPVTFYVQKNSSVEPNSVTEKMARETLDSKRDLDPNFEFQNMNFFDDQNQNDSLLSGSFRNEELDLEFRILMTYTDMQNSSFDGVRICFSAPKLNIEVPYGTKIEFKADGSGYGLAKLNETTFLRLAWSMDPRRKLHGQILKNSAGQIETILNFESSSVNTMEGKSLKRCVSKRSA